MPLTYTKKIKELINFCDKHMIRLMIVPDFRGFLFKGLERTSLGGHGTVFLTSIIFAIIHVQYGLPIILVMLLPMAKKWHIINIL